MNVLITGGSGFIGLAMAERLLEDGHRVVLFDRQPAPLSILKRLSAGRLAYVEGDVRDSGQLSLTLCDHRIDHVIHAAAITPDQPRELHDAHTIVDVNISGTVALMEACSGRPTLRRMLLLSSVAVYGFAPPPSATYREDEACPKPAALYGITKLAAEQIALRLADLHEFDLRVARLGPVFGPWEYATGVRDMLSPHTQVLESALAGKPASLPHALKADWIYSRDAARALVALLEGESLQERIYNVGGEVQSDLLQWRERLAELSVESDLMIAEAPHLASVRYGLPQDRAGLSTERLRRDTGWQPQFTLATATTDYLNWHRQTAASEPENQPWAD